MKDIFVLKNIARIATLASVIVLGFAGAAFAAGAGDQTGQHGDMSGHGGSIDRSQSGQTSGSQGGSMGQGSGSSSQGGSSMGQGSGSSGQGGSSMRQGSGSSGQGGSSSGGMDGSGIRWLIRWNGLLRNGKRTLLNSKRNRYPVSSTRRSKSMLLRPARSIDFLVS